MRVLMRVLQPALNVGRRRRAWLEIIPMPVLAAIAYPFMLKGFHWIILVSDTGSSLRFFGAAIFLAAAFSVPFIGWSFAASSPGNSPFLPSGEADRRLAYLTVVAPTLFVFLGVVLSMVGNPIPEDLAWIFIWLFVAFWPKNVSKRLTRSTPAPLPALRIAHGVAGAILLAFVLFHLTNHFVGLAGMGAHSAMMKIGRAVYRSKLIEPILVGLMLFQIVGGFVLFWRWSSGPVDKFRAFQVASGLYLSLFILGHMNSVFIYARTYLKIQTDWAFATGAPTGLISDPWNIRLVPHYWFGVFFVLSHLLLGLRVVFEAHGVALASNTRFWLFGLALSALAASLIMAGMCGLRLM